ncbi:peptidoglycan recognition protein family protein [Salinactinospora qingdaonensis]|uniref:Peptidoglycan recognition family protein n=1 Tax=Salinactinospora qingdaonensis TaxID=702744 RepID=A0ABP7F970_9ACTN
MTRRSVFRGAAVVAGGVLVGGAIEVGDASSAFAAGEPAIHHRGHWNARGAKYRATVLDKRPDHIVVHHTATTNSTDYSRYHAFRLSRAIQRYHMDHNGWSDVGQQLTISRGGHIMEGRNRSLLAIRRREHVVGAHTASHNSHTIGIENEGSYASATPPGALMVSLVETCAWLCYVYGLDPDHAIVGHRDYNFTSCPGDRLYSMLPEVRRSVRSRLAELQARVRQLAPVDIAVEHRPSHPGVPQNERRELYYHGPAVGEEEAPL